MQTITLNIIKKNRVYFACKNARGYDVKLKIDDLSKDLELKEQELIVNDISVRTKYGTDIIYQMAASAESASKEDGFCTLSHPAYNKSLVGKCRNLAGQWDADSKAWVFPKIVESQVEELDEYYNANMGYYDVTFKEVVYDRCAPLELAGFIFAEASGRDSGARLKEGVILLSGKFDSGGSAKNWVTEAHKGTVARIKCSEMVAKEIEGYEDVSIKKVEQE